MTSAGGLVGDRFLAAIIGRETYRVDLPPEGVSTALAGKIRAAQERPVFLYAKVATTDTAATRDLGRLGFSVVDTNITLERPSVRGTPPTGVRSARAEDRDGVVALAERSFAYSRLHLDPAVPPEMANRSRGAWVANFFAGQRGDGLAVAGDDESCAGFLLWLGAGDGILIIDLIAVAAEARRRGYAKRLIDFVDATNPSARVTRVGTQIANLASLRLYQGLGFAITATQYVLHFHRC